MNPGTEGEFFDYNTGQQADAEAQPASEAHVDPEGEITRNSTGHIVGLGVDGTEAIHAARIRPSPKVQVFVPYVERLRKAPIKDSGAEKREAARRIKDRRNPK